MWSVETLLSNLIERLESYSGHIGVIYLENRHCIHTFFLNTSLTHWRSVRETFLFETVHSENIGLLTLRLSLPLFPHWWLHCLSQHQSLCHTEIHLWIGAMVEEFLFVVRRQNVKSDWWCVWHIEFPWGKLLLSYYSSAPWLIFLFYKPRMILSCLHPLKRLHGLLFKWFKIVPDWDNVKCSSFCCNI